MKSNRIDEQAKSAPNGAQSNQNTSLELLSSKSALEELEKVAAKYGVPVELQLAGAVGTWLDFVHKQQEQHLESRGYPPSIVAERLREYGNLLNYERHDSVAYFASIRRGQYVSEAARRVYQFLVDHLKHLPIEEAGDFAEGLGDLLAGHVGFADEVDSLKQLGEGAESLGLSHAVDPR